MYTERKNEKGDKEERKEIVVASKQAGEINKSSSSPSFPLLTFSLKVNLRKVVCFTISI